MLSSLRNTLRFWHRLYSRAVAVVRRRIEGPIKIGPCLDAIEKWKRAFKAALGLFGIGQIVAVVGLFAAGTIVCNIGIAMMLGGLTLALAGVARGLIPSC
jgi:hypothetical protein